MSTNDTDIVKLNLNDTFYDWYLRTNQVIDYVNPINIYDVFGGSGLSESRTGTPGTIELSVATNGALYGITTLANTQGVEEVVLDFNSLSVSTVQNSNVYAFQKAGDVIYKVEASDMLPPDLNGDHAFAGTITVGDLIVDDGTITINNTGSTRDNCGIIIQSTSDTDSSNVFFTYDQDTAAWYSSQNLGVTQSKGFVTNSNSTAIFPFIASETQAQVDLRLQTTTSGIPERFSINAEFDATNTLTFSHYSNNALISDILELTSTGTNGSSVIVKDTITITDVLNSTPFSASPATTSIPVTDSVNGYLDSFVNRTKILSGDSGIAVGDFVYLNASGQAIRTDANDILKTNQIGLVESISGSGVGATLTIILSGAVPTGILSGLTSGSIYYLSETAGDITSTNPENTNGTVGKPVLIATSSTTGIIIPDFTNTGTGSVVIGGGTINNAFSTIITADDSVSIIASGESTVTLQGLTGSTGPLGSGIEITSSGSTIQFTPTFPAQTPYTLLRYGSSGAIGATSAISPYSVVSRSLTGNIDHVQLTPGTLLGRRDDDTDANNPVEALNPTQVLDLLGFSSNSYLKSIVFEDSTGVDIYNYPDTDDGETLYIRSGDNITFEKSGSQLLIHAGDLSSTNTTPGGPTQLFVGVEGSTFQYVDTLGFRNVTDNISWTITKSGTDVAYVSANIPNGFLKLSSGTSSGSHRAGSTLSITGSNTGITSTLNTANETFTLSLNPQIFVNRITERGITGSFTGLIFSASDVGGSAPVRNSLILRDTADSNRTTDVGATGDISSIVINGWDDLSYPSTNKISTSSLHTKCVSMFANTTDTHSSGDVYTLPFRFYEIVVDKLTVANLTVDTAAKTVEYINTMIGFHSDSYVADACTTNFRTDTTNASPVGLNGVLLKFTDDTVSAPNPNSYIFRPSAAYCSIGYSNNVPVGTFVISNGITFGDITDATRFSPVLSRDGANSINLKSYSSATSSLRFAGNSTGTLLVGCNSASGGNGFMDYNTGSATISFVLRDDSYIGSNTIDTSFTIGRPGSKGYKFNSTTFTNDATDKGKVLRIGSVVSGVATVESAYVIRPLAGATVATDPINTLYYVPV